ncbi:hypothetical protein RE428_15450 [Marinobacter nanhaiticus D15-8W]|uniref:META domain-containing protein n=1 Tax=Marinobacter nanhaiticus D15-8W TaxID=626887 RepID=N6WQ45_9GAMM|nr:META domain-containing protein [Marinobacter nanhaiticus]ENO13167.1 META domain-containing protein [Marinobacter nanhaiticus D15-8W]BES70527.1 hypothetical protein RE428_15450 [Marinobacter nanhaiticus D15-8W]
MKANVSLPITLLIASALSGCAINGSQPGDQPLPLNPGTYVSSDERQVWVFWENGMFERSAIGGEETESGEPGSANDAAPQPQFDWGQWHDLNGMGVAIARGGQASRYFLDVASDDTATLKGSSVTGPVNLVREDDVEPLETPRPMAICFMTQADAPLAYEPLTRRNYPVQMAEAYPQLEAAYLESGLQPPQRLPIQVSGHWVLDDAPDGVGDVLFLRAANLEALGKAGAGICPQVALQGTYWVLRKLGNEHIETDRGKRAIHVTFGADGKVSGLAGCNRFSGPFTRSKDDLQLGPLAATRMMCPERAETENAFFVALERTERFAIEGETLLLMTDDGKILAEFEAGDLQ